MATEKVQILIDAKNNASRELNQVSRDLTKLNQTGSRLAAIGKGVGLIGAAVGTAVTAYQIGRTATELAKVAGEFTTLKNSFDNLAAGVGASADDMLNSLRNASQGMISDMSLVQAANRALLLGVADTSGEMAQLLQVAVVRGQAMGLTAEQAFNDIVTGIGRMSPLILDNLGIVTGGEKVFEDYAAAIGKAADELTDAEKKQALLNSVVESSAGIVATATASATSGFETLKASIDNAKVSLGLLFSEEFNLGAQRVAEAIDTLITKFAEFNEMLRDDYNKANFGNLNATEDNLASVLRMIDDAKVILDDLSGQLIDAAIANEGEKFAGLKVRIDGTTQGLVSLGRQYNEIAIQLGKQVLNLDALANGVLYYEDFVAEAMNAEDALDDLNEAAGTAQRIMSDLVPLGGEVGDGLNLAAVAMDILARNAAAANTDIIELLRTMGTGQTTAINFAGAIASAYDTMAKVYEGPLGLSPDQKGNVKAPQLEAGDGMKAITLEAGFAAGAVSRVNQEFEDLKSTISGIVTGAIGPVAGVDANDLLPRPDAVNENARRLADIAVNGLKGQDWLSEFAAEVPGIWDEIANSGDPQGTAARILKDFQDGLRPELLDKERAKELVKRALQGDANTKALIDEIAGELASELGISLSQAKDAAAGVLGGGTDAGTTGVSLSPKIDTGAAASAAVSFSSAFVGAIESGSLGADLGAALMVQVSGSVALVEQTGKDAGDVFVRGFTGSFDGIPTAFIAAVVSLAMPGIMANMSSNGGRTGAADV